jgi:hypothetical protein
MCSIEQRLEEIGQAIEELAVQAGMPAEGEAAIEPDDSSRVLARLAELWGLLADLDPEVARRLAGYQALLWPIPPTSTAAVAYLPLLDPPKAWARQHRCLAGVVQAAPKRQRCCRPGRLTTSLTRTRPGPLNQTTSLTRPRPGPLNQTTSLTRPRTPSNTFGPPMLPARPAHDTADPPTQQQDYRHVGFAARRAGTTRRKLAYRTRASPDRESRQEGPEHAASQRI